MNKPSGYDEAQTSGEFTPVNLGGHYAIVKQVAERQSSTGKDMIVVLFDFCEPDQQKKYFETMYNNDDRGQDKKWPFNGSKYIMVADYNDPKRTSRAFKTFCTCVEKSNNFKIQWGGDSWAQQFKGKKIGIVYGAEENEYDGRITMRYVPKWFCSWDSVATAKIPAPIYLDKTGPSQSSKLTGPSDPNGFMEIPAGAEEEIPF